MNPDDIIFAGLIYYCVGVLWSINAGRRKIHNRESNGLELWFLLFLLVQAVFWPFGMVDRFCFDQEDLSE